MLGIQEPELFRFSAEMVSWNTTIRQAVNSERIRTNVEVFPGPRNRLYQPDAMNRVDSMIIEQLTNAGWQTER